MNIKPFTLSEESMYDLNTYIGRLKHFAKITDMRLIFLNKKTLTTYQKKLEDFKNNPFNYDLNNLKVNKDLWEAKYGVRSAINSSTGNVIPIPARMCAFVPVNIPIAFGLICMSPTKFNIMFFNFLNQSYNAMMNYANSSGSEDNTRNVLISYILAVVTSVGSGIILKKKLNVSKGGSSLLQEGVLRMVPSMAAGFLNLFFMRSDYITKGISVVDQTDKHYGHSRIAGGKGVMEGAFSRLILPLPLVANYFLLKFISKFHLGRNLNMLIELFFCGFFLGIGLPVSIALFKEKSKINVKYLEEDIKRSAEEEGQTYLFYNKGL